MGAKPRPFLGFVLGLLLGIVVVSLLWQLGVLPPDRLVLFGVVSITAALVTIVLTQQVALARMRFIVVMTVCGIMAGVAVASVSDTTAGGSLTDGCYASATSSIDSKTPAETSLSDPFDIMRTDTVAWMGSSDEVFTNWTSSIGIEVGGFPVKIWSGSSANEDGKQSNSGSEDVSDYLSDIEESTGIALAGIYHVYGHLDADQGTCDMNAYVRLPAEGTLSGTLNIVLWTTLAVLVAIILIMAGVVRRSISMAAAASTATATVGTTTVAPGTSAPPAQSAPPAPAPAPPVPPAPQQSAPPETQRPEPPDVSAQDSGDTGGDSDISDASPQADGDDKRET